ncbi:MAG: hypothetical protein P8J86_09175 [Phycisphaerales bacterium]|nr:hypothetical protein [Phycisphaerales bacterium]
MVEKKPEQHSSDSERSSDLGVGTYVGWVLFGLAFALVMLFIWALIKQIAFGTTVTTPEWVILWIIGIAIAAWKFPNMNFLNFFK